MTNDPSIRELLEAAELVAARAHCPYSKFHVGAAVRAADNRIFTGCNVEKASYGLTICAERAAIFRAVAAGCRVFTAIAIVADGTAVPFPCGACRQVLAEFNPEMEIWLTCDAAQAGPYTMQDLLPLAFDDAKLRK